MAGIAFIETPRGWVKHKVTASGKVTAELVWNPEFAPMLNQNHNVSIHASTREATARFGIRMPDHPHILPLFYPDFFLSSLFNSKFTLISREPQPVSMLTSGSHL